jgi:hypothetical protein
MSASDATRDDDASELWVPEDAETDDDQREHHDRGILTASPLVWTLLVVAAAWGVWSTATKGSGKPVSARAVIVPTDGSQDRTVAAIPCSALRSGASSGGSGSVQGADTVVLPRDSGARVVLLGTCAASGGGASAGGSAGKAIGGVIVLPPGTPIPSPGKQLEVTAGGAGSGALKANVQVVFQVPASGGARTIIVPPCSGKAGGSSKKGMMQPTTAESGRGILLVPPCGST